MSVVPPLCPDCRKEGTFVSVGPFPPGLEVSYAVIWHCPACGKRSLDVCPLGPLVPTARCCLNCGASDAADHEVCPGCNLTGDAVRSLLRLDEITGNPAADAQLAFQRRLYRRALATLNQLLVTDPANEIAWQAKDDFLKLLGFHKARRQMVEGALHQGAPASLLVTYGALLREAGEHREAVAVFQEYLAGAPNPAWTAGIYSDQAQSLAELGDLAGAEAGHRRAVADRPTWAPLYLNFADLYVKQRRWPEAEQVLTAGLAHATDGGDRIDLLNGKAQALAAQMRGEEALACADEALRLGSASARSHFLRGRALALLGRLNEAQAAMQQVLRVDPDNGDARRALQQIAQAQQS